MGELFICCSCDEYGGDPLVCAKSIASGTTTPCECDCHKATEPLRSRVDEIERLRAGLSMIAQIVHGSTRVTRMIAEATLEGANLLDEDVAISVCEGSWKKP